MSSRPREFEGSFEGDDVIAVAGGSLAGGSLAGERIVGRDVYIQSYKQETAISVKTLRDAIEASSTDEETTAKLNAELDKFEKLQDEFSQGIYERQQAELNHRLKLESDKASLDNQVKLSQESTKRITKLVNKDLVSVIVGGILLIMFSAALIFSEAFSSPELFETVFLILLGFFFGQGASRISAPEPEK